MNLNGLLPRTMTLCSAQRTTSHTEYFRSSSGACGAGGVWYITPRKAHRHVMSEAPRRPADVTLLVDGDGAADRLIEQIAGGGAGGASRQLELVPVA